MEPMERKEHPETKIAMMQGENSKPSLSFDER
jgi:hypothetical protein